ncbi:MAG TPA: T9SS type A sorting domain-containing protein [Lacibacter sp.]|nr:T9SS type A sorting domain-containing protein [Lacibacter sp.]HMO87603.1 T9SS type A sorting domain-containing protein [Lacibacter sp.]HMP87315.1 T9SS type A sorting domain-containing protein [Lacibacter sp.]
MKYLLASILLLLAANGTQAQGNSELLTFPIELKYFKAERKSNLVKLHWLAPCQVSEATFEIQQGTDGRNFATIHSLTADQVRCTQPFDFTDPVVRNGRTYYRIRMTAITGASLHSFTLAVLSSGQEFALNALLPSVVQQATTLHLSAAAPGKLQLTITSLSGQSFQQRTVDVMSGTNQLPLELGNLPAGNYILRAVNERQEQKTIRFIKL